MPLRQRLIRSLQRLPAIPAVIIGTLLCAVLLHVFKPPAEEQDVNNTEDRVRYMLAEPQAHQPQVALFGRVQSPQAANLTAVVTAHVSAIAVRSGARVATDEVLIQLDDTEAALARDRAKASRDEAAAQLASTRLRIASDQANLATEERLAALAEKNRQRVQTLFAKKLVSQTALDEAEDNQARAALALNQRRLSVQDADNERARAEARLASAEAQFQQAQLDWQRTRVVAPFDGIVTNVNVAVGERVRPGEPLAQLFAYSEMEVRAQIPDRFLPLIRQRLHGDAESEARLRATTTIEGRTFTLTLKRLAGDAAAARGGIDGLFEFDDGAPTAALGRPLTLTLTLPAQDNLLALPPAALHGLNRLYRIDSDNRLERVDATIVGERLDDQAETRLLLLAPDMKTGERIMITQLPGAIGGLAVDPKPVAPLPAEEAQSE